jgi:hypothetical protein
MNIWQNHSLLELFKILNPFEAVLSCSIAESETLLISSALERFFTPASNVRKDAPQIRIIMPQAPDRRY